ncbi:MAG: fibronectin type III domain-containing protein, partial [Bacteroidales bacterium]|nr:fibronectin type III domain-containing protein [Candidatus Colicola caccequi]
MKNKFLSRIGQWHTPPYLRKCLTSLKALTLLLVMLMSVNVWGEDEVAYTITYTKGTSDSGTATPSIATQKDKDGTDGSFATLSANSYAYARTNGLHLSSGKSAGNATLTLSDDGKVVASKIVTNALAKSNKSFSIEVTFTDNTKQTATFTPGISTTDCTLTISDANASKTIKSIYYSAGSGTGTGIASTTVYTAAASTKTALDQVSNLSAGTPSATSVTISWTGISDSELDGYKVEYKVKSAAAWTVATSKTTETSFTLTGLTPSTEYAYQITSVAKSTSTTKKDSDPQAGTNFTTAAPQKYYAHFYVNGTENETFKQYLEEGAAINMPTEVDAPSTCSDKVFVGWVGEANKDYKSEDTAPDYITNPTMGSADIKFYAVFADESAGGTTSVTKDIIAEAGVTASQTLNGTAYQIGDLPIQLTATKGTSNWPVINYNATNGNDLRFYKSSSSVTFATTNSQPITKIEFKKNSTTNSNLNTYFSANVGTLSSNVWTGSSTSVTITFSNTDNYKEQMYIVNVTYSATGGKTYSNYTTSCVVDDRTPVKMTGFTADETTLLKGATTNTSVTNDQTGWTAAYTYSSDKPEVATVS